MGEGAVFRLRAFRPVLLIDLASAKEVHQAASTRFEQLLLELNRLRFRASENGGDELFRRQVVMCIDVCARAHHDSLKLVAKHTAPHGEHR